LSNENIFINFLMKNMSEINSIINKLMRIYRETINFCKNNCKVFNCKSDIEKCSLISLISEYLLIQLIAINTFINELYLREKNNGSKIAHEKFNLSLIALGLISSTKTFNPKSILITKVHGESMQPTINPEDILIILPGQTAIEYLHKRCKPLTINDIVSYVPLPEEIAISIVKDKQIPLIYHRIINKESVHKPELGSIVLYEFKGDNNPNSDPHKLPSHLINGLVVKVIRKGSREWELLNNLINEIWNK